MHGQIAAPQPLTLVILSGLPGTGKTTIAEHVARLLGATLLSKDEIEAALWRTRVPAETSGWAAYELMGTLARVQLGLRRSVVLDSVATYERIRSRWRELAYVHGARLRVIETHCSDERLHRTRLEERIRNIPDWPELTWDKVLEVRCRYEPWSEPRLRVDTSHSLATVLDAVTAYVVSNAPDPDGNLA
jgi:predicted kinase